MSNAILRTPLIAEDGAQLRTDDDAIVFLINHTADLRATVAALLMLEVTDPDHLRDELGVDVAALDLPEDLLEY